MQLVVTGYDEVPSEQMFWIKHNCMTETEMGAQITTTTMCERTTDRHILPKLRDPISDPYLKLQGIKEGVKSYDAVVYQRGEINGDT